MLRVASRGSREVDASVGEGVGLGRVVKVVGVLACRHGGVVAAWVVVGGTLTWVVVRLIVEVRVLCRLNCVVDVAELRTAPPK